MSKTLTADDAKKLLNKNISNLVEKLKAGKTLNASEMALVQAHIDGEAEPEKAQAYVSTKADLAKAIGCSRPTLDKWMKARGAPEPAADGRHSVGEWKRWMRETGRSTGSGAAGEDEQDEVARLTAKGIQLRNRRLELEIAEREGVLVDRSEVVQDLTQAAIEVRRELYRMAAEAAPQVAGLPVAEIQIRLREKIDEALGHLHASKWGKAPSSNESR